MDGVAFSIKLLEWGCTIQDFEGRKILVSSDLKMGRFKAKKLLLLFYYLAIGSHYLPFLKHNFNKVYWNICAKVLSDSDEVYNLLATEI